MRRPQLLIVVAVLTGTSSATATARGQAWLLPPPTFRPSQGWITVTTGPLPPDAPPPEAWAVPAGSTQAGLGPYGFTDGLQTLGPHGIIVWAATIGRGGPDRGWSSSGWPLHLSTFRVDHGWETQPAANVQQRLRWVAVAGWHLDVRVYFGTQQPSRTLLRAAQAELNRLRLPAP
jgi:hypothetical protein